MHVNGASPAKLLPESMGGGVAVFDYDGDGDQDLLFVNSAPRRGEQAADHDPGKARTAGAEPPPGAVLYRNDGPFRFSDVTAASGIARALPAGFDGMGAAVGDVDGDGRIDLFLTAVGSDRLLLNRADGFVDATATAGVGGPADGWSTGAAFFDAEGDGDLDLFVVGYVDWSAADDEAEDFRLDGVGRAYRRPQSYGGAESRLYLNRGDGTFADTTATSGVRVVDAATGRPLGKGMAVMPRDLDGDGLPELVVANDTVRNFLFHNLGGGSFEEVGELWGAAYGPDGQATGAMGSDAGWLQDDGRLAMATGNYAGEPSSLYLADREDPTFFTDTALAAGVGGPTRTALTFGLLLLDADLDGKLDLLQVNGHVELEIAAADPAESYRQPPQLFWNAGETARQGGSVPRLLQIPGAALGDLARPLAGRGAAYADFDGDGDLDLVVTQVGGPARLLRNDQTSGHHWLRLELRGRPPRRQAIGATVELAAGGRTQRRTVLPTRGYLSQVELPLSFGLGDAAAIDSLTVTWPGGGVQQVPPATLRIDALNVVEQTPERGRTATGGAPSSDGGR